MKVSEVIKYLQSFQTKNGDVELYKEVSDGRCTWEEPFKPSIRWTKEWYMKKAKWMI